MTAVPVLHNTCGVHPNGDHPNRGSCPVHSVPCYREPGGLDWFTDNSIGRRQA